MSVNRISKPRRFSTALNTLAIGFVVALTIMGATSGTAHVVTGIVIEAQATNAGVINITGRQRMLSQRIPLLANSWTMFRRDADEQRSRSAVDAFELLGGLNKVVSVFQLEHEREIQSLQKMQNIAMVVLVLALGLGAALICRPLLRRLHSLAESLSDAAITDQLTEVNN
ncbi:MAG: type IV pili methyl-accepting chemotaxis transducer N-terminal domain-containing protein [Congregibacter sp.]